MPTATLRWVAASSAVVTSDYKIYTDETAAGSFVLKDTVNATDRGDGAYAPFSTTLNGALTATDTTIVLTSGTNFAAASYVVIDKEMILLGSKSTNTFTGCTRGIGGSVPRAHSNGATVYAAHESSSQSITFNSNRYVVRARIAHLLGSDESIPVEVLIINPPNPPDTAFITLYGIRETEAGGIQTGETATLTVTSEDPYGQDSGESVHNSAQVYAILTDGFFYFFVRRDAAVVGRSAVTLSVGSVTWAVTTLPDQAHVNFLDT